MFSNLDRKDPTQILKRFDQNTHYPTFGDSSVITEDAPSQGRFYLRVKKDDSNFIIGNFITESQGTDLIQLDRGLFGVLLDYKSNEANVYGDRSNRILAFASSAGTITSSDELRGTGGSVYFLHHADLSVGSERVRLEVRSPDTGVVLASTPLRIDQDYEIDYFQGRITLMRPLSSYVNSADLIRSGSGNGNVPVLVARYEYTPPAGSIMGQSVGGRAEHWFGDAIRLGITGQRENSAPADQILIGNDVLLKVTNDTWFKASYGRTDGQGFSQTNSIDGGLNYTDTAASITKNNVANAWKLEGAVNESDIISNFTGKLSAFYESYEAGFSALGNITPNAMSRAGARLDQTINANNSLLASFENRVDQGIGSTTLLRGEWTGSISRHWLFKTGLRYNSTVLPISSPAAQGARLDGGLQITYSPLGSKFSSYTFGQATINHAEGRSRNNRFGLGLAASLSDTISIQAEASNGDGGWGLNVKALSRDKSGSETYIGYQLYSDLRDRGYDPQNWMLGANRGALVFGSSKKISENLTVTSEEKYGHGGSPDTLANSYGLKYAPDQNWSFGASMEKNTVYDTKPDGSLGLDRTAATSSLGYISQDLSDALAIEYRQDKQRSGTQTTWLIRDKLDLHPEPSWHVLGRVEYDFTDVFGNSLQAAN